MTVEDDEESGRMSDESLRDLERDWRETGADDAEARYLRARLRAGDLSTDAVSRMAVVELRFPGVSRSRAERPDAVGVHLGQAVSSDPLLRLSFDHGTAEHVLAGPSEAYVRRAASPLKELVAFRAVTPRVRIAYRQSLAGECELESRWVRQSG
jgi:elongation factor G